MTRAAVTGEEPDSTIDERPPCSRTANARRAMLYRAVDCCRPLLESTRHDLHDVPRVIIGRGPDRAHRARVDDEDVLRIEVADPRMSREHAELRRSAGRWIVADLRSRNGTQVAGKPVDRASLSDGDVLQLGRTFFLFREMCATEDDELMHSEAPATSCGVTTFHEPLARELALLETVARSPTAVVIHGETGTGKGVLAQAIHAASGRSGHFVAVNCGAIPESLVESELFGVRRGAYSDAREDRPGVVRTAHEGTLFLDEIGDLRLSPQAAFLRVLQEREVTPLGQSRAIPVDFRLITATHRDLERMTERGSFREDLFARICGFNVQLPPLRERREDIGLLLPAIIRRLATEPSALTIEPSAMRLIFEYGWPHNVRELEKRIGTAVVLARDGEITAAHLGDLARRVARDATNATAAPNVDDDRRMRLVNLLAEHGGNITLVARALGKDRAQVRRWIRRFGIDSLRKTATSTIPPRPAPGTGMLAAGRPSRAAAHGVAASGPRAPLAYTASRPRHAPVDSPAVVTSAIPSRTASSSDERAGVSAMIPQWTHVRTRRLVGGVRWRTYSRPMTRCPQCPQDSAASEVRTAAMSGAQLWMGTGPLHTRSSSTRSRQRALSSSASPSGPPRALALACA